MLRIRKILRLKGLGLTNSAISRAVTVQEPPTLSEILKRQALDKPGS